MRIVKLNPDKYLTTTEYNPSPHRTSPEEKPVSERTIPMIYTCENCNDMIAFKPDNFQKHNRSNYSNLQINDRLQFENIMTGSKYKDHSFIDFYCPKCRQPTTIIFKGNPSGYWGFYEFTITEIIVIKDSIV
jgi:hypothetical protein